MGHKINFRQTNVGEEEICNRIHSATAAFQQHKHLLRNFKIFLKSRVLFLYAFVRSRLTYGCSTWTTTDAQMRRLDECYRMFLRKIIKQGYTRTSTQSFKITNSQLHQICKTTNLSDFIKTQQKKYLAHIIRRPNNALINQITFSNKKQKKKGRPSQTLYTTVLKSEMTDIARFARNFFERVF